MFVSLASLKDPSRGVIEESLTSQGFSNKQINKLRESDSQQRMLFILDGFYEINCKQNLHEGNKFEECKNIKVMITARSEYLFGLGNYLSYFGSSSDLQEYYIRPFSVNQRGLFFNKIVKEGNSIWKNPFEYENCFDEVKGLSELVTTPYLLRIITDILPSLIGDNDDNNEENQIQNNNNNNKKKRDLNITRSLIYETFTEQEFLKSRDRMRKLSSNKENGGVVHIPEDFDEVESFRKFSMHLAVSMFVHRENTVTIRGSDYRFKDEKIDKWDEFFTNSDLSLVASRFGAPLSCVGRQRSFRHKSLQEYFTSLMLLRELSLFGEEKNKLKINDDDDIYFNGRYLIEEPSIRDFLLEMMKSSSFANKFDCDWKILLELLSQVKPINQCQ